MKAHILDSKRTDLHHVDPNALVIVGLDTTHTAATHALFDERAALPLDESMIRNVMVYGVLQSVSVVRNGEVYEVIDGRQRVKCAREANKRLAESGEKPITVPVMIKRGLDESDLIGALISTNEHRRGDDLLTKAAKAARAQSRCGLTATRIALDFGVTRETIQRWIKLHGLHQTVKDAIAQDKISSTAALVLVDVPREEQPAMLAELLDKQAPKAANDDNGNEKPKGTKATRSAARAVLKSAPSMRELRKLLKADANGKIYLSAGLSQMLKILIGQEPLEKNEELCKALQTLRTAA